MMISSLDLISNFDWPQYNAQPNLKIRKVAYPASMMLDCAVLNGMQKFQYIPSEKNRSLYWFYINIRRKQKYNQLQI